jgi:four helix bundle protein
VANSQWGSATGAINSYRDLIVWQESVDLATGCYKLTAAFPPSELYGMTSQIRRASVSVAANIAEGHGRDSTGNFIQFLRIAQGSLKELETHVVICVRVGLLDEQAVVALQEKCDAIGRMLRSLIRTLEAKS